MSLQNKKPDIDEVREVLKEFLSKYKYLYEIRLQKLVYEAELYTLANYDARLTNAEFKPYIYGTFSETVRKALSSLDVEKEVVTRDGEKTRKYLSYGVSGGDLSDLKKDIISSVHTRTKSTSTSELASNSKESWLYQNQEFGESMDFHEYWKSELEGVDKEDRGRYDPNAPELIEYNFDGERKSELILSTDLYPIEKQNNTEQAASA